MNGVKRDCQHPRVRHEHGTPGAYASDRCRCFACHVAHAHARAEYRRRGTYWVAQVSAVGTQRRLQALYAAGWTWPALGDRLGVTKEAVRQVAVVPRRYCMAYLADRIAALYDELSMTVPAGTSAERARRFASKHGWLKPLDWDDDDIDDPASQPHIPGPETAVLDEVLVERYMDGTAPPCGSRKPPERLEAIRRLAAKGLNDAEISRRIHLDRCAVGKERERHGIPAGQPRETAA